MPSFVAGIVVGCLASILVAATAVPVLDNYQPDTIGFPNLDASPVEYEYEFPDILESAGKRMASEKPVRELVSIDESSNERVQQDETPPIESFLLQVGSFELRRHADVFRASLMLRGYNAATKAIEVPEIGPRFRVVVGPYASKKDAETAIQQLKTEQVDAILLGIRET